MSDHHLFVSANGRRRPREQELARTRLLRSALEMSETTKDLAHGLSAHNSGAQRALHRFLVEQDAAHQNISTPLILAQTGDVEAFGRSIENSGTDDEFGGFNWLETRVYPELKNTHIAQLHGNHDVWSGGWPLTTPTMDLMANAIALMGTPTLAGSMPDAPLVYSCRDAISLQLFRFNTVSTKWSAAVRASGEPSSFPPPDGLAADAISRLNEAAKASEVHDNAVAIRILLTHHPIHNFQPRGLLQHLTSGHLADAQELANSLSDNKFNLVLAGHRHEVDPAPGTADGAGPIGQEPLPDSVIQLSTGSATQSPSGPLEDHPDAYTVCRYQLLTSKERPYRLAVTRTVFIYSDGDRQFSAGEHADETIISDLALE